jgi:hypothetical protein
LYDWTLNGTNITGDTRYTYSAFRRNLTIPLVAKVDAYAQFSCSATENVTGGYTSEKSNTFSINVYCKFSLCMPNSALIVYKVKYAYRKSPHPENPRSLKVERKREHGFIKRLISNDATIQTVNDIVNLRCYRDGMVSGKTILPLGA